MLTKRNAGDLPVPFEGIAEEPITRARAIKLAGATVAVGAFAALWPAEADAANKKRRRQRRARRARRRRQAAVTSNESTINFGDTTVGTPVTESVEITNNGTEPVTLTPTVVGDGFTLVDAGDITLAPGETASVPVILNALLEGAQTGTLTLVDAADGLVLETVELVGNVGGLLP